MPFARYFCIFINVRLGAGAPPIGIPFFWPSAAMPNTVMDEWSDMVFLKFNGATFSASTYPKLALIFPGLMLPELRGEFLRVWDDGRGVDSGRALLSAQSFAMQNVTGSFGAIQVYRDAIQTGAFRYGGDNYLTYGLSDAPIGGGGQGVTTFSFDMSRVANTASETRPRNIAFNFLVRAK